MKGQRILPIGLGVILLLVLGGGLIQAQGPAPQGTAQSPVSSAFTYQGQLKKDGNPVDDNCDIQFTLYDAASEGNQIGTAQTREGVAVQDGLFTIPDLAFAGAFQGEARWLEVAVRCTGDSGYAALAPRQELTPSPYALYSSSAPWSGLSGVPAGFADNVDNDTTYSAGPGLVLAGTQFAVDTAVVQARVSGACGPGYAIRAVNADGSATCEPVSGSGPHDHWGQTWSGSGTGLALNSSDGTGLAVNASSNGLYVGTAGSNGLFVNAAAVNGLAVESAGDNGLVVAVAGGNGVNVDFAGADGVRVYQAGSPSASLPSAEKNGFEVGGAEGYGLYVGHADHTGVGVDSASGAGVGVGTSGTIGLGVDVAGTHGLYVGVSGQDGVHVEYAGNPSGHIGSPEANGFEVTGAAGFGVWVGRAEASGILVRSAGASGLVVDAAGDDGVNVGSANRDGVGIGAVGAPSASNFSDAHNGFEVAGAAGYGLYVGRADLDGVYVKSTAWHGLNVELAGVNGVHVASAGNFGVYAAGNTYAGYFQGTLYVSGGCVNCLQVYFGRNAGDRSLEPGDVVAIAGVETTALDNASALWQVGPAGGGAPAVGVMRGRAEVDRTAAGETLQPGQSGTYLVPRDGAARPDEYVTIVVYGPVQVRASTAGGPIQAGARLTVDEAGRVRPLQTVVVNGVRLAESAPVVGIALEAAGADGLIWVLVNPQ